MFQLLCERDDLLSVPAGPRHWFDMGREPCFWAIRLFGTERGWDAEFTGDELASSFPDCDLVRQRYMCVECDARLESPGRREPRTAPRRCVFGMLMPKTQRLVGAPPLVARELRGLGHKPAGVRSGVPEPRPRRVFGLASVSWACGAGSPRLQV